MQVLEKETSLIERAAPAAKQDWDWPVRIPLNIVRSPAFWAFLGALLLTGLYGRVAVFNLNYGVVGGDLDGYENLWNDHWVRTALLDLHRNPLYTDYLYYPIGISLRYHTLNPLNGLFALPLWPLIGSVAATNLKFLLSLALTVFCAYLFFRDQTGYNLGSFVAAAVFTFANDQVTGFFIFGQAEKLSMWWLPLYLFFMFRALRFKRWKAFRNGLGAFIGLLAMSLTDWQFVLYAVLLSAGYFLFCLFTRRSWLEKRRIFLKLAAIGVSWAAVTALPLLLPMLKEAANSPWLSVSDQSDNRAKALNEYFDLSLGNPGYLALALLAAGLYLWRKRQPDLEERRAALFWGLAALVAAVLTLGPELKWFPRTADETTGIPLPYQLLYKLPVLSIGRDPGRFYMITLLGTGLLLALALRELLPRAGRLLSARSNRPNGPGWPVGLLPFVLAALFLGITLAGFMVKTGEAKADPPDWPPFYYQLGRDPGNYAIMELPLFTEKGRGEDTYEAYQSIHHKARFGGRLARDHKLTNPNNFILRSTMFRDFFFLHNQEKIELYRPGKGGDILDPPDYSQVGLPLLNYYNVRYIILYPEALQETNPRAMSAAENMVKRALGKDARPVYQDARLIAYRVPDAPPATKPLFIDTGTQGWYPAEKTDEYVHRWADPCNNQKAEFDRNQDECRNVRPQLPVFNLSQETRRARIQFTLISYTQPLTIRIALDGYEAQTVHLDPQSSKEINLELDIPPSRVTPSLLAIWSEEKSVPTNNPNDLRFLSFRIQQVRLAEISR